MIVDESADWRVIARSYDKFFNVGEPNAPAIDWTTAAVLEKLDGSLMTLYWYRDAWHVASSGMPDAGGVAHSSGMSFAELFRQTWGNLGYRWPAAELSHLCFMFELMTPENRIIVSHERPRIVLHGVRDLSTMRELDPAPIAQAQGWECVRVFPLTSANACVEAAKALDPLCAEGFVVRDAAFGRIKVKSPRYVALAHLKDAMTGRRMLEIVRSNESDEFLSYFPEFRPTYEAIRRVYDALCDELEADFARLRGISGQREFAAEAARTRCASPLFAVRCGKSANIRAFFAAAALPLLERALGVDLTTLIAPQPDDRERP